MEVIHMPVGLLLQMKSHPWTNSRLLSLEASDPAGCSGQSKGIDVSHSRQYRFEKQHPFPRKRLSIDINALLLFSAQIILNGMLCESVSDSRSPQDRTKL